MNSIASQRVQEDFFLSFLDFIDGSGPKTLGLDNWTEWEAWIRLLERPVFQSHMDR